MRKDFYIFRHGQTDYNAEGRWAGSRSDIDLNETGIEQAKELAQNLRGLGLEVIFASNLIRAKHTAVIAAKELGIEVKIKPEFHEGNFGIADGRLIKDLQNENPQLREDWNNLTPEFMNVRYPEGESKQEIQDRIFNALQDLLAESYNTMGIACHGAAIRYLLLRFGIVRSKIANGQPFHLTYDDGDWCCNLSDGVD